MSSHSKSQERHKRHRSTESSGYIPPAKTVAALPDPTSDANETSEGERLFIRIPKRPPQMLPAFLPTAISPSSVRSTSGAPVAVVTSSTLPEHELGLQADADGEPDADMAEPPPGLESASPLAPDREPSEDVQMAAPTTVKDVQMADPILESLATAEPSEPQVPEDPPAEIILPKLKHVNIASFLPDLLRLAKTPRGNRQ